MILSEKIKKLEGLSEWKRLAKKWKLKTNFEKLKKLRLKFSTYVKMANFDHKKTILSNYENVFSILICKIFLQE